MSIVINNPTTVVDSSITTIKIADASITTVKLADGAITSAKLSNDAQQSLNNTALAYSILLG
jgi:hypothetical protein